MNRRKRESCSVFIHCLTILCITYFICIYTQVYVQHLLKNNKETVWKLIHTDNAHIYICGCVHFRTSPKNQKHAETS